MHGRVRYRHIVFYIVHTLSCRERLRVSFRLYARRKLEGYSMLLFKPLPPPSPGWIAPEGVFA